MVQSLQADRFSLVWWMDGAGPQSVHVKDDSDAHWECPAACNAGWYRVDITGLKPGTSYQYTILAAPQQPGKKPPMIACGRIRTAPRPGSPFRFVAMGDSGSDRPEQRQLARIMGLYEPDLLIHTGDVIHLDGALHRYPEQFFRPYADLLPRTCVYPCLGNHDWDDTAGEPFFRVFVLPENGPPGVRPKRYYWFDFADVRFIALDSNDTFESIRTNAVPWLDSVLAQAGDRWKVLFFHHPLYTNGGNRPKGALLQYIRPLIDRWGVDVVLSGHNHMYERSHPLCDGKVVKTGHGTTYITTGAGGAALHGFQEPAMPEFLAVANNTQNSFTVVDVTPDALSFRQIGETNDVIDQFVIPRPVAQSPTSQGAAAADERTDAHD